jgi:filamentous hemagglutinin
VIFWFVSFASAVVGKGWQGAMVGGNAGAFSGYNVDRFNLQLHLEEKKVVKELANGDSAKERRLEAAGCALVHCAAEYASGTADYAKYSALEKEGAGYMAEQTQLKSYAEMILSAATYGGMVRQTSGSSLFHYSAADEKVDQSSMRSGMAVQRPGKIDYLTVRAGAGPGVSISVNLHTGKIYGGLTIAASREKWAGIVFGLILDNVGKDSRDKARLTNDFLAGQSVGGNACLFGMCGGLNHAVGGKTSVEVGVGFGGVTRTPTPGGNADGGSSIPFFQVMDLEERNE